MGEIECDKLTKIGRDARACIEEKLEGRGSVEAELSVPDTSFGHDVHLATRNTARA
jgi:hypothetical protein